MNQTDFGEMLGAHQSTISMWEIGVTSPPIDEAREIIERLGGELNIVNLMIGSPECPFGYNPYQE